MGVSVGGGRKGAGPRGRGLKYYLMLLVRQCEAPWGPSDVDIFILVRPRPRAGDLSRGPSYRLSNTTTVGNPHNRGGASPAAEKDVSLVLILDVVRPLPSWQDKPLTRAFQCVGAVMRTAADAVQSYRAQAVRRAAATAWVQR